LRVERRGRLVEQQHLGCQQQCPDQGNQLRLAPGQVECGLVGKAGWLAGQFQQAHRQGCIEAAVAVVLEREG
jgi:hypothetical protein